MEISQSHIIYILTGLFCLVLLTKFILVKKENTLLSAQLTQTTISLENNKRRLSELQKRNKEITEFQQSIKEAELTTHLQKSRLLTTHKEAGYAPCKNIPEKYSYIRSLTEKGMSVNEIAAVLSISLHEANQLVTLTMISPES